MGNKSAWDEIALGEVIKIKHGWPFKSEFFSEELSGKPIVVNIGNFRYEGGVRFDSTTIREYRAEYPREYELTPGDILLVMTCQTAGGEILGIPGRIPDDGRIYLHNQRLGKVVVTAPERANAKYLYWLFLSPEFNRELYLSASGTKILHTSPNRIADFRFRLPPLAEQRAIAQILGTLDDKIELNRRMNETLEAMARAIFKSWFVDFDPVRAKLALSKGEGAEGHQPFGMDAETAALFPESFQESAVGKIPKGWMVKTLGDLVDSIGERVDATPAKDGERYIALDDMPSHSIDLSTWRVGSEVNSSIVRFRKGDILFGAMRPYFHKVGLAQFAGITRTTTFVLRPKKEALRHFALLHFSSDDVVDYATTASVGTTIPYVRWDALGRCEIALPPDSALASFERAATPATELIGLNGEQSRALAAIRDALLPKLISGEIRVRDAESYQEAGT